MVTNNHVIAADGRGEVEEITVTMPDGTEYPAKLVGSDAASDLAVLKIERRRAASRSSGSAIRARRGSATG